MRLKAKGRDDCCCKSWKDKINELWEKYQGVVKGVKAGSVTAYPDGDGIADLDNAVADAIAQQVQPMLTDFVTDDDVDAKLEDYVTQAGLTAELTDYATQTDLATKQDVLVSGETIRTINGRDLLGEGNLQFNDVLPDFSEAAEGDALVIGSEGLPEWGEVEGLPDATDASAGDVLTLDADKIPSWIPKGAIHSYATFAELAQAIIDHPDGYFYAFTANSNFPVYCDYLKVQPSSATEAYVWIRNYPSMGYPGTVVIEGSYNSITIRTTLASTSLSATLNRFTLKGNTSDSTFEATKDTHSVSIPIDAIRGIY